MMAYLTNAGSSSHRTARLLYLSPFFFFAGSAAAQIPADNDPMIWAYDYAYTRAICDNASPQQRASRRKTDATVNCWQAQVAKENSRPTGIGASLM